MICISLYPVRIPHLTACAEKVFYLLAFHGREYREFQKELCNGIPIVTVASIQYLKRWIVCTTSNINIFSTLATQ
jgi:hypothetical protein